MNDYSRKQIPNMSDLELEDVVSVLMGVLPEGEDPSRFVQPDND